MAAADIRPTGGSQKDAPATVPRVGVSPNDASSVPSDGGEAGEVNGAGGSEVSGQIGYKELIQDAYTSATSPELPCEFTCGVAGSGKTYYWRERIAADPSEGVLAATTGIAAVNLGTTTLNSLLRYFDTDSLRDSYLQGSLCRRLRDLREDYRRIVIDEVSMMDGEQLSILVRAALEANSFLSPTHQPPLGLTLVGDFAQLPPVKARWAFESDEWGRFVPNTTKLTKVWRQDAGAFLDALNLTRSGNGDAAAQVLTSEGLEWHTSLDIGFDGTTIVSKNYQVDRYNGMALDKVPGPTFTLANRRWGKQRGEWKVIPDRVTLKRGAYVMLLANSYDCDNIIEYARRTDMRSLSETIHTTSPLEVSPLEGRKEDSRGTGSEPSGILQPELHVEPHKKEQSKMAGCDGSTKDGEFYPMERGAESDSAREEQPSERITHGRIRTTLSAQASTSTEVGLCVRASSGDGREVREVTNSQRKGTPSECYKDRQPTRESRIDFSQTASSRSDRVPVLSSRILDKVNERKMAYANGDCGHVISYDGFSLLVRLVRDGSVVRVERVIRDVGTKDKPSGWKAGGGTTGHGEWLPRAHWMPDKRRFVEGQVDYWPVRLAYCSTVHKSQGLSLDRCQVDIRDHFFGSPAMLYVALSRCRTLQGLRIVGQPERFVKQCSVDPRVKVWL